MIGQVVHRFVRNPNFQTTPWARSMNRGSPFENTLTILEDPAKGRKLFLIGTTNSSTLLAKRTQKLIEAEKPDSVLVQTNREWWKIVRELKGVDSQEALNTYNSLLARTEDFTIENNPRGLAFKARFYPWILILNAVKRFPSDFHPFIPGLEMKYAIEGAKKNGSYLHYAGQELNAETVTGLLHEKRMDLIPLVYRLIRALPNQHWKREFKDHHALLDVLGGENFAEIIDNYRVNWFIKLFERYAPRQKKIILDQKDVDLFYSIYRELPGKTLVAVVNQWHVPGIEAHWRHTTGTEIKGEPINPIGDFDIEKYMESNLVNDALRDFVCKITKSEPATGSNYLTMYFKEHLEYERNRHASFLGHNDPHLSHDGKIHHHAGADSHSHDHSAHQIEGKKKH